MLNIGAFQQWHIKKPECQCTSKARLKRWVFNSFRKTPMSGSARMCSGITIILSTFCRQKPIRHDPLLRRLSIYWNKKNNSEIRKLRKNKMRVYRKCAVPPQISCLTSKHVKSVSAFAASYLLFSQTIDSTEAPIEISPQSISRFNCLRLYAVCLEWKETVIDQPARSHDGKYWNVLLSLT